MLDVTEQIIQKWEEEQTKLADRVDETNSIIDYQDVQYVVGMSIANDKEDETKLVCGLCVYDFQDGKKKYSFAKVFDTDIPYMSGYVGFRESVVYEEMYKNLMINKPQYSPDVIMLNTYGRLHPRKAGCACHVGVDLGVPVIGIGQTILNVDGLVEHEIKKKFKEECTEEGDFSLLKGKSGYIYGAALRTTEASENPVHITIGNKISLQTAINITLNCCINRTPEPIRGSNKIAKDTLYNHIKEKKAATEEIISNSAH